MGGEQEEYGVDHSQNMCKNCNQQPIDASNNGNSILCKECREAYIRYPFPKWMLLFAVALVALSIYAAIRFYGIFPDYLGFKRAEMAFDDRKYYTAYAGYQSILEKREESSEGIGQKLFLCSMRLGDYETAADLYNQFYVGKEVSDSEYKKLNLYGEKLESYFADLETYMDVGLHEITDFQESIEKIKEIPNFEHSLLFQYTLACLYASLEDYEQALKCLEATEQIDSEYPPLYSQFALAYRHLGDFEKARYYASKALQLNTEDVEAYRQLCVLDMLEGDYGNAVENAAFAYEVNPYSTYLADTLAIAYYLNGNAELCDPVVAFAKENELDISGYEDLVNGHKTIEDIYR